jgi:tRNA(fMet)-specific endonuclease VapC
MRYMLDTNICIYLLKKQPPEVFERFAQLDFGDVAMSCLTLAELRHGAAAQSAAERRRDMAALDALIEDIPALPFDEAAASAFGELASRTKLRRTRALDNLIAAHAMSQGAVLVTNNERDFAGYPGLGVENWAAAAR